jgi:hypothetical protein
MEPRRSMTRYAAIAAIAFVMRGLTGNATAVAYGAAALMLTGVVLDAGYRISVRGGLRPIPAHRAPLDTLVRAQWVLAGAAGVAIGVVRSAFDVAPLALPDGTLGLFLHAALTAVTIGIVAIFASSMIDWYWVLPRVSGIVRMAPCEQAGGQRWARTTGVWLFHRGVATMVVAGCLYGTFLYMGSQDDGPNRGVWYIAATIVATATLAFLNAASRAVWLGLNPRVQVGDRLDVHGRRCHVVDVSLQGAKYVELEAGERSVFVQKEDGSISLEDFGRFAREGAATPCAGGCKRVNWYCRCNPQAYD